MKRLQGFASIKCDTMLVNPADYCALLTLMAKLSGAFTEGTALTIVLNTGALLICRLQRACLPSCLCMSACMWALPRTP